MNEITYLTGVTNEFSEAARRSDLGLLGTPAGGTWAKRSCYPTWAADNGCFVDAIKPGSFDADGWLAWLRRVGSVGCLWATLPDVVGNALATWGRSKPYVETVRELGFPVAIVMQNGLEDEPEVWAEMLAAADVLFIGGSAECLPCGYVHPVGDRSKVCPDCGGRLSEWKLGKAARDLVSEALAAGKKVHMGRVNSGKRLRYAAEIGCHTADGTFLKFCKKTDRAAQLARLTRMLDNTNGA